MKEALLKRRITILLKDKKVIFISLFICLIHYFKSIIYI